MARLAGVIAAALLLGAAVPCANAAEGTPIEKVLEMMDDLRAKATKEKHEEAKAFDTFKTWCHETERDNGFAIDDGYKAIDQLNSDIEKHTSDAKVLGEEIAKLNEEIDAAQAQSDRSTRLREKELEDYQATHAEYTAGLDSLASGVRKLKKMMSATESMQAPAASAASLVQNVAATPQLPEFARAALASFVSEDTEGDFGTPEAAAFESQSGGVVDLMLNLEEKLRGQKKDLETRELNQVNAFNLMMTDLTNQIKADTGTRNRKASAMKKAEAAAAQAKGDLAETTGTKNENEKYVKELKSLCKQKSVDFAARQKLREEEMEAIANAMEIISSGDVAGAGKNYLPGLVQKKPTSLAQLRSSGSVPAKQRQVASFLEAQAGKLGSKQLSALATRAAADPFVKVRNMIEAMINKLQDEASEEADHKGWCDGELSTNEQTRTTKTTRISELNASIEGMTAEVEQLMSDVASLTEQVATLDASVKEATDLRNAEHAKNTATLSDAKAAIGAVNRAVGVLKSFYTKAAGATALVQQTGQKPIDGSFQAARARASSSDRSIEAATAKLHANEAHAEAQARQTQAMVQGPEDDAPDTFDAPFTGSGGEGGIIGMMEVILSDFERLEAETDTSEAVAAKEYDTFMTESSADREAKEEARIAKGSKASKVKHDIRMAKKDLKSTTEELDAAESYYNELKPSCVDSGVSYEDRVKARKEEIASLQEALKILVGEE